jgi:hypothetical protein
VLGEDEQLAAAVGEFRNSARFRHSCSAVSLESAPGRTRRARASSSCNAAISAGVGRSGVGEAIGEGRARPHQVVFILFGVGDAPPQLRSEGAGRGKVLQFLKQVCCFSRRRRMDSKMAIAELASRR